LTPEINSLTRRLNVCRNVSLRLQRRNIFPLRVREREYCFQAARSEMFAAVVTSAVASPRFDLGGCMAPHAVTKQ
jgi:hypothetical protein